MALLICAFVFTYAKNKQTGFLMYYGKCFTFLRQENLNRIADSIFIPLVYEVYRGYIVFAFSVCLFVCVCVNFFSVKDFSGTT